MSAPNPDPAYDYEHFTFGNLMRILPVGQTNQIDEMDFTLLALECYRVGFVATALLEQEWQMPDSARNVRELPQILRAMPIITNAQDDLGNHYAVRIRGGSGGGGGDVPIRTHFVFSFAPALDPAANVLSLTLIMVERPRYEDGQPAWGDDEVAAGPWTMTFSLDTVPQRAARVSVAPVAGHISANGYDITVTTLERYAWGFVVNSRVDWTGPQGNFPQPTWSAVDDRGGTYGTSNCGGSGGGDGIDGQSFRLFCQFQRPLDPNASTLTLQLKSLGLDRPVRSAEENRFDHWERSREAANLGEISVTLVEDIQDET